VDYNLPLPDPDSRRQATAWLIVGVASLVIAGLFSILLVLSRTPTVAEFIPWTDFFHVALVVHVDLSVLIWFLAFAGVLWNLNNRARLSLWGWLAVALACAGTLVIAFGPFAGIGAPLMNNYIPVLQHPAFLAALGLVGAGFSLLVGRSLLAGNVFGSGPLTGASVLRFGLYTAAVAAAVAVAAFIWSYRLIPDGLEPTTYYEYLFWGGGHVLQFTHTQLLLVVWLWLCSSSGLSLRLNPRLGIGLFALGVAPVLLTPLIYLSYDLVSAGHRLRFTELMQYGGGLAAAPLGLLVLLALLRGGRASGNQRPLRAALIASLLLFAAGGIIGFMIEGVNVVIPAHYHGSIVGVTLAFMGMSYHLLPLLGFRIPAPRLAVIQPYVYGGGQLMHIIGLAWSGGYGVARKTAGASQGLDRLPEIAGMALMGLGGLIAIIGGLLFVIVAIGAMWPRPIARD